MNKRYQASTQAKQGTGAVPWILFLAGCLFFVGVLAVALTTQASPPATPVGPTTSAPHYPQAGGLRTITFTHGVVLDTDENHAQVEIVQGRLPSGTAQLTVLSDANCTPDTQGISHCLNRLSYGSGEITVRHAHRMMDVPCLLPGETLQVVLSPNR